MPDHATNPAVDGPSHADAPVLDVVGLGARCFGNRSLMGTIVAKFSASLPATIAALDAANPATLSKQAHQLKGSAATVGAMRVSRLAASIDHAARANDLSTLPALIASLRGAADEFASRAPALLDAAPTEAAA